MTLIYNYYKPKRYRANHKLHRPLNNSAGKARTIIMNPCWRSEILQIYVSKIKLKLIIFFQLAVHNPKLQQYFMFTILNVLNEKENFLDRRKHFTDYIRCFFYILHNIFLCSLQSSRARARRRTFQRNFSFALKISRKKERNIQTRQKHCSRCARLS